MFPLGIDAVSTHIPRVLSASEFDRATPPLLRRESLLSLRPSQIIVVSPADSAHMMHRVNPDSPIDLDSMLFGEDADHRYDSTETHERSDNSKDNNVESIERNNCPCIFLEKVQQVSSNRNQPQCCDQTNKISDNNADMVAANLRSNNDTVTNAHPKSSCDEESEQESGLELRL